jgi:hypothetical protein
VVVSRDPRGVRDDRPSTGPLARSEKAALVSGSSSALLLARRRPAVAAWTGWVALGTCGAMLWTGWVALGTCGAMLWTGRLAV